jgi:anthranilate phosphoribosyltransferase
MRWPDVLTDLVKGRDLTSDQASWAMEQILGGDATAVQIAGFAVALRTKGESVGELAGLADAMLAKATPVSLDRNAVDVVGSGGDRANTVNVSTMAAIVAASCGATVVKHGNRAASSACGTADVLSALGIPLDVAPARQQDVLAEAGIVFLFAPMYHPSLRHAATARGELGIQTTFNFLGPLANPARPSAQAVGVADARMAGLMAGVLAGRGCRGLVFHGSDGLDELTTTTTSQVWLIGDGRVSETLLDPQDLGLVAATREDLVGGDPQHNAAVVRRVFDGEPGPVHDIVALNAAAALLAFEGPDLSASVTDQLRARLTRTRAALADGSAAARLTTWVDAAQRAVSLT